MFDRSKHPSPQFIRTGWQSLDGEWNFCFDDDDNGIMEEWFENFPKSSEILVPFTYETELSGINKQEQHQVIWYNRQLEVSDTSNYVLHFEGVDYHTSVWINGRYVGEHSGAYEKFSFDIGNYLIPGTNEITVRVSDSLACEQSRGKQRWLKENFMCWYVQTTGIWKSVWLEKAEYQRLKRVKLTPDTDYDQIIIEPELQQNNVGTVPNSYELEITVSFENELVSKMRTSFVHQLTPLRMDTRLKTDACWGTKIWEPSNPYLYDISFKLFDSQGKLLDEVISYFGMRKIAIENGTILLNNHQLYQRLILDQGYWPKSGITPPSIDALEKDIQRVVEMGYNGVRKHQKIEDDRFYYLCDTKGLLVWCEMPSTYTFNDAAIENISEEWLAIVNQHYNHPSIITWVPFNESWGIKGIQNIKKRQDLTVGIYYLTKSIDDTRPVITNDGWQHTVSDIITIHDYEEKGSIFSERFSDAPEFSGNQSNKAQLMENKKQFNGGWFAFADGYEYQGQPIIISEFGGIAFANENTENWGYGHQVKTEAEFMERFNNIHQAIQDIPYIQGFCYTQLTDVEQEINGLLTPDRSAKVDLSEVKKVNERKR